MYDYYYYNNYYAYILHGVRHRALTITARGVAAKGLKSNRKS